MSAVNRDVTSLGLVEAAGLMASGAVSARAVASITSSPEISQSWASVGVRSMSMSRGDFQHYLRDEIQKYAKIIDDARIPGL